ncbi:hypothetical protein OAN47_03340 [Planctomycetota bacterium]|nr:hypothetical protein [Planctomycetota bacterium]
MGIVAIGLTILSSGCQSKSEPVYETRIISEVSQPVFKSATLDERFRGKQSPQNSDSSSGELKVEYDLPEGWTVTSQTSMRRVNLLINGDPNAECYLTAFKGGGSLKDNVARWCRQMGQDMISDESLMALPRAPLLGAESIRFEIDGSFDGGMSSNPIEDARMIAFMVPSAGNTIFLKATAPRQLLIDEADALNDFAKSLRFRRPESPNQQGASGETVSSLEWTAPEGWTALGAKPMREVTFAAGKEARCWITILGGDGGGTLANVNRWRSELMLDPLLPNELENLPKMKLLGGDAFVVEGTGSYSSMGSEAKGNWSLIGLIRNLEGKAIFIKLIGPASEVEAARSSLELFADSVKER